MIYQSDAVEFAYRVMMAEHPKYPLYHISSGEVISQMKLAELIQQNAGDGTTIRDDTVGEGYRLVLDGRRYRKEFDGKFCPIRRRRKSCCRVYEEIQQFLFTERRYGRRMGQPGLETAGADFPHAGSVSGKPDLFYPVLYDS